MKVQITFDDGIDPKQLQIMIENQWFFLESWREACRTKPVYSTDGTNILAQFSIDTTVQAAGYGATRGTVTALTIETMENDGFTGFKNVQFADVAKIEAGVSYLIPSGTSFPVPVVQNCGFAVITGTGGTAGNVVPGKAWLYDAAAESNLLNNNTISGCITFQRNGSAVAAYDAKKADVKKVEVAAFANQTGAPHVAAAILESVGGAKRS